MNMVVHTILALLVVISGACAQQVVQKGETMPQTNLRTYKDAVQRVRETIAPDRRTVVFDISVSSTGKKIVLSGEVGSAEIKAAVMKAIRNVGHPELIDDLTILPEHACLEKPLAIVKVSVAPLRAKPAESAEMISQALMGSVLNVLKLKGSWVYVQMMEDGYLGWVDAAQCVRQTREQADQWLNSFLVIVTDYFDLVRNQPSASAQPVCDVTMGAFLQEREISQGWYTVSLPDGRVGYLEKKSGMMYRPMEGESPSNTGKHREDRKKFPGLSLPVGRDIAERVRLFRVYKNCVQAERNNSAARCRSAGNDGRERVS